jgi:hypothetical protein
VRGQRTRGYSRQHERGVWIQGQGRIECRRDERCGRLSFVFVVIIFGVDLSPVFIYSLRYQDESSLTLDSTDVHPFPYRPDNVPRGCAGCWLDSNQIPRAI